MSELTPMMQQYLQVKEEYNDCIVFYRLGDFYEMFFEDAKLASRELEITLTGRDCGLEERAPMCGVPHHSAYYYIAKLIQKGYKVAICEQVEDPSVAKGIVKREVVRVITPGTVIEQSLLDEKTNNYILTVCYDEGVYGMAYADVSTGELATVQIKGDNVQNAAEEVVRIDPKEMIVNSNCIMSTALPEIIKERLNISINKYGDFAFAKRNAETSIKEHFKVAGLEGLGLSESPQCTRAVGALLHYLADTQKVDLKHINKLDIYHREQHMVLDSWTRRNLEMLETIRTKDKKGTLLWLLDRTQTAMGGRMLRKWVERPLVDCDRVQKRLDAVEELKNSLQLMDRIKECTVSMYDLERLLGRIVYGSANARDMLALKQSVDRLPKLKRILSDCKSTLLQEVHSGIDPLEDIGELIEASIHPDPPAGVREGGIIKDGYNSDIDSLRRASREGRQWIAELEKKERERTSIKSLKVGYNKVFGYYIEITKANLNQVPDDYIRKQTLANSERYVTPELKEMENTILGAHEKSILLEYKTFVDIREGVAGHLQRIKQTAHYIAVLDTLYSLAKTACDNRYTKPVVTWGDSIEIKDGRHPVVEKMMASGRFVPNDTYLDRDNDQLCIITGPNMAGKSTYMRQVALIVLMAQMGSFVPASYCKIGIVDRIFTRVGASDDLASGQSTFMVEMSEVANILNNATPSSLLILDEIGRGTSTFDGLSIAWAVIEHLADKDNIGARTLFATHYHQLTELEGKLEGVKNYCIAVKERGDDIIFLRKVIRGGADKSYGIQVAGLAGLPKGVIGRARDILAKLEETDFARYEQVTARTGKEKGVQQLDMFGYRYQGFIREIACTDIETITPLQALNLLNELKKKSIGLVGEGNDPKNKDTG
ncbi:MAG: DNA mismatch repair protein MutS [Clostridia bacterium]